MSSLFYGYCLYLLAFFNNLSILVVIAYHGCYFKTCNDFELTIYVIIVPDAYFGIHFSIYDLL